MKEMVTILFLLIIGSIAIYMSYKLIRLQKRINKFDSTRGEIRKKWVDEKKLASGTEPGNTHRIYVEYEFKVNNVLYVGNNFYAIELLGGERAMSKKRALKMVHELERNTLVYFNPNEPNENYIYKKNNLTILILIFGVIFIFLGLIQLLIFLFQL